MSISLLSMLPWFVISGMVAALNITSAVILLKDRHIGAWLMLGGSGVSLLGLVGHFSMQIVMLLGTADSGRIKLFTVMSSVSYLGAVLFSVGLLLHALYQKSKTNRVTELEAIITSLQNR